MSSGAERGRATAATVRPVSPGAEEILGLYFPVLDSGFVALVDYMGTDACIERAARVSYGYGTRKATQTRGLVRYLRRHKHTTPSEMVEMKFTADKTFVPALEPAMKSTDPRELGARFFHVFIQ